MAKSKTSPPSQQRLTSMMAGENPPVDLETIRATVRRALVERPVLPRAEEALEITRALRSHLAVLVEAAVARRNQHRRNSGPWYLWETVIDRARRDMYQGPGCGLRSAVTHMQALGRTAEHILNQLDQ
ncbi:DUF6415 family natural product biosynthesis protein [Streptomyces sp. NPDC049577]|uniref:DUF6415 family natural product biosynthesis protein n=1 Tax=Streptomyces sp. NPDC049577 TaxID=3155153 RepID=UPI0034192405